jgi:hypothetical protein
MRLLHGPDIFHQRATRDIQGARADQTFPHRFKDELRPQRLPQLNRKTFT